MQRTCADHPSCSASMKRVRRVRHWTSAGKGTASTSTSVSLAVVVTSMIAVGGYGVSLGYAFVPIPQPSHTAHRAPSYEATEPIASRSDQLRRLQARHAVQPKLKSKYLPFGVKWNAVESSGSSTLLDDDLSKSSQRLKRKLQWIETTLLEQELWSMEDVHRLFQTIHSVMADDGRICGLVDFLSTLLDVTSRTSSTQTTTITSHLETSEFTRASNVGSSSFVTRDILLASMWHYLDFLEPMCVSDITPNDLSTAHNVHVPRLPPSKHGISFDSQRLIRVSSAIASKRMIAILHSVDTKTSPSEFTAVRPVMNHVRQRATSHDLDTLDLGVVASNDAVDKITRGAEQILRVECLARTVAVEHSSDSVATLIQYQRSVLSNAEAARWRGSMLSVVDFDWRSLMIRCVACLYRLESILGRDDRGTLIDTASRSRLNRTPEVVWAAREGMRVYATLAQQLGLDRLKARIEDCAFQILYQRQYRAVTALYANTRIPSVPMDTSDHEPSNSMESVSSFLQSRFIDTLFEDSALMGQLESLQVSARVKERFSLWKKLVKKRFKEIRRLGATKTNEPNIDALVNEMGNYERTGNAKGTAAAWSESKSMISSNLSVSDVSDVVALRVILRARKWHDGESEETIRAREQLLCYYVREKLRSQWPSAEPDRVKDYIQYPKANGYQSLHYTSTVSDDETKFPFEVQVRSDEMHYMAEHGVAKHWAYKLGNQNAPAAAVEPMLLLPDSDTASRKRPSTANIYLDSLALSTAPPYDRPVATTGNAYLDSLAQVRELIAEHQVYVFVTASKREAISIDNDFGKLVSIPSSSTVETAIRSMIAELGGVRGTAFRLADLTNALVWRNGSTARLDEDVKSGDVLVLSLK